jgi:hypothetical protein
MHNLSAGTSDSPAASIDCPRKHRSTMQTEHRLEAYAILHYAVALSRRDRLIVDSNHRAAFSEFLPFLRDAYKAQGRDPRPGPGGPFGASITPKWPSRNIQTAEPFGAINGLSVTALSISVTTASLSRGRKSSCSTIRCRARNLTYSASSSAFNSSSA